PGAPPKPRPLRTRPFAVAWNFGADAFESGLPLFNVEAKLRAAFTSAYRGRPVPIFSSKLLQPVLALDALPTLLTRLPPAVPFYVLANYQKAPWHKDPEVRARVAAARRALGDRDRGDISGENLGYPWDLDKEGLAQAIARAPTRAAVLEALHAAY